MRWVTWRDRSSDDERAGLVDGDAIRALPSGVRLLDVLDDLDGAAERARRTGDVAAVDAVELLAPIPRPPSVRDFYAFEQHVRTARERRGMEMDPDWYELPVFYFSNPHGIVGPDRDVAVPPGCEWLDYELEVAVVVGRDGADLDPATAERHIAGYCVMNDWSARDLQGREMKQLLGPAKGKDFATSLGPMLVTPDELGDLRLEMTAHVNGREYSRGNLGDCHWSFGEMLAYASRGTTVAAGDVIGSGTVGTGCILELALVHGSDAYPWLRPGDEVSLTIEGLGTLTNRVVARAPA